MNIALNFRGELRKVSGYLVDELDQLVAAINASWNEQHTDNDVLIDGSVTVQQLNFSPTLKGNIVATINASDEGIKIAGTKVQIDGTVTFGAGYDPTGKVVIGTAAADVNANTTTISGGKITTNTITAAQLLTDLAIANKIRSTGATAFGTGTGFWIDATGTPTFRVGNPGGARVQWTGTDLEIYGVGYKLTDDDGLYFYQTSDENDHTRMIRWENTGQIGCNGTRMWLWGPGAWHNNIYTNAVDWFENSTLKMHLSSAGLQLENGASLFIDSGATFYFDPAGTDQGYPPLVLNESTKQVHKKTNTFTGTFVIWDGAVAHNLRFNKGILEDHWT